MTNKSSVKFFETSADNARRAMDAMDTNASMWFTPYYSKKYHKYAAVYPFVHAAHVVRDLFKILEGLVWLGHALFNEPKTSIPKVLLGMASNVGSMICNCINAITTLVYFLSRSISTIFNLGYLKTDVKEMTYKDHAGKDVRVATYTECPETGQAADPLLELDEIENMDANFHSKSI